MNSSTPPDAIPPDDSAADDLSASRHIDSPATEAPTGTVHPDHDAAAEDPDCYETIMAALYDDGDPASQSNLDDNTGFGPTIDHHESDLNDFGRPTTGHFTSLVEPLATEEIDTDQSQSDATIDQASHQTAKGKADPPSVRLQSRSLGAKSDPTGIKHALPKRIGKFAIKRELGRGAFGVVYLGYDEELQRNVAIKVSLVSDPGRQEKLRTEASKAAQIDSNGIVPVYHIGTTDQGLVFIVHKFIPGCSLRDILKRGPLSPSRATALMRDLACAMAPAHQQDILHRDLKPDNVLIDEKGNAWIADFGLAISEREQNSRRRELAGTPPYMSPEQIKGRVDFLDPRSDLWALGVMYYELLSGKLPFRGKTRETLTDQICERDPRPLQQYGAKVLTDEINRVFLKACAKAPADRYATVIEFATALDDLIEAGLSDQNILGESTEDWIGADDSDFLPLRSQTSRRTLSRSRSGSTELDTASTSGIPNRSPVLVLMSVLALASVTCLGWLAWQNQTRSGGDAALLGNIAPTTSFADSMESDQSNGIDAANGSRGDSAGKDPPQDSDVHSADSSGDLQSNESGLGTALATASSQIPSTETPPKPLPLGTKADPMVVAIDGSGSHTKVADAIKDAPAGGFVHVRPGTYAESLLLKKSLTLVGVDQDTDASLDVIFENDTAAVITVDSDDAEVLIESIRIVGKGTKMTEEFNAVEVVSGTLLTMNAELTTSSYNCVKVISGATYGAKNCEYLDSREIAVSGKNHTTLQLVDCRFRGSGVEVIGGSATITGCEFYGARGVWCQQNQSTVRVTKCKFENGRSNSIVALEGGKVQAARCQFLKGKKAIQVLGGQIVLEPGCVVNDYAVGAFVSSGKLTMKSTDILDSADSAIQISGNSDVTLNHCKIENAAAFGIDMVSGKLRFSGGSIVGCDLGCINLTATEMDQEDAKPIPLLVALSECTLTSPNVGVAISQGKLWLDQVFFESGKTKPIGIGVFVDGGDTVANRPLTGIEEKLIKEINIQPDHDQPAAPNVVVSLTDSVNFDESVKISIFAKGNAMLDASDKTRQSIQETAKVLAPARFKEASLSKTP